jgi:hypothetical protein
VASPRFGERWGDAAALEAATTAMVNKHYNHVHQDARLLRNVAAAG